MREVKEAERAAVRAGAAGEQDGLADQGAGVRVSDEVTARVREHALKASADRLPTYAPPDPE